MVVVSLLAGGTGRLVLFVTLWVYQQRAKNPLLTARGPASTIPVAWIVLAICAAARLDVGARTGRDGTPLLRAAAPEAATTRLRVM
jgi:hypothetical protein